MISIAELNQSPDHQVERFFKDVFFSNELAGLVTKKRPFESLASLVDLALFLWDKLDRSDKIKSIMSHPKIGDVNVVKTKVFSRHEQSGIYEANSEELAEFERLNHLYQAKFGYLYLVFAKGKSSGEMLRILKERLNHSPEEEFLVANQQKMHIIKARMAESIR